MTEALRSHRDLLIGAIAGQAAVNVQAAAVTLFEAGGKDLLAGAAQAGIRRVAAGEALHTVATFAPALLAEGAREAGALLGPTLAAELAATAGKTVAAGAVKAAGGQILRSLVRVGGLGMLVDGTFGAIEGVGGVRRGTMTRRQAAVHTATEAGTGAVSAAAGVALAAGVVALTGGLAVPAVTAIGAGGALAAKLGLTRLLRRPAPTA
jgi:hypothetical protein